MGMLFRVFVNMSSQVGETTGLYLGELVSVVFGFYIMYGRQGN